MHLFKRFGDFVETKSGVRLPRGKKYQHVAMAAIIPGIRYVGPSSIKEFKGGGAKFAHGDTLFARITPCLENGKIAQFRSASRQAAFGSTEFFVFRALEGRADPAYIYYLSITDWLRAPAEKSMSGASGRQRADLTVVLDADVPFPNIETQRCIASILSAYDDLIENNTRRIAVLEEMARRLYEEWFVHFRFPGHEEASFDGDLPKGWEVARLAEIADIVMGQSPKSEYYNEVGAGLPFHQGVTNFGAYFPTDRLYCTVENRIAEAGDILFSVRAPVGRINIATSRMVIGRGLSAIRSMTGNQTFLHDQLRSKFSEEDLIGGGTIFKAVTKKDMHDVQLIQPVANLVAEFEHITVPQWGLIKNLSKKNTNLRAQRDLLLPKLISGEIDVSKVPETTLVAAE